MKKLMIPVLLICIILFYSNFIACTAPEMYIAKYKNDKKCAISYTFDDGLQEHFTHVFPEMERLGLKGTFWICGAMIDGNERDSYMSWEEMRQMHRQGHEISNHGWSHTKLTHLYPREIMTEIRKNDSIIEKKIGHKPRTFCYPYNARNNEVIRIATEGRVGTRMEQIGIGGNATHESLDTWVQKLIQENEWGIGMTHGITQGYDAFEDASVFWEHLRKVKAQEDEIWVAPFYDVSAYTFSQKNTRLEAKMKGKELHITPQFFLNSVVYTEPLTVVIANDIGHHV